MIVVPKIRLYQDVFVFSGRRYGDHGAGMASTGSGG